MTSRYAGGLNSWGTCTAMSRVEPGVEDDHHVTLQGHARILADPLPDCQLARRLVPGKLHRRELTGLVAVAVAGVLVEVEGRVAAGVHVDLEQPAGRLVRMLAVRPHRHDGPGADEDRDAVERGGRLDLLASLHPLVREEVEPVGALRQVHT